MQDRVVRIVLLLASVVALGIGTALVLAPVAFEASAGVSLGGNASALSETRGAGGGLLAIGLVVALGGFQARYRRTALLLAGLAYLGYGVGRSLGILVDGLPARPLQIAAAVELSLGLLCLGLLRSAAVRPASEPAAATTG